MTLAIYPSARTCEYDAVPARAGFATPVMNGSPHVTTRGDKASHKPESDIGGLILAIAAHADMEAFHTLFQSYGPRIRAYLLKMTRDPQAAEDLTQETMLAIWRKAAQFSPDRGPASAWIFTIARNIWIDAWRRERRPELDPNDPALTADPEPDASTLMEQRQSYDALHDAMKFLPEEQVELIRLSFFDDASHTAIATKLGLPIGTVKSRIRLAFRRLRVALEGRK